MHRRQCLALFGAGMAGSLAGCPSGIGDGDTPSSTVSPTPISFDPHPQVTVGEVAHDDTLSVVAEDVTRPFEMGSEVNREENEEYVLVQFALKNRSPDKHIILEGIWKDDIIGDGGYSNDPAGYGGMGVEPRKSHSARQLAPGEVTFGARRYTVPESASDIALRLDLESFEASSWDHLTIDLSSSASTSGQLRQDLEVDVREIGDTVEHNDIEVTLNGIETATTIENPDVPGGALTPVSSDEYLIADASISNTSDEEVFGHPWHQVSGIKDGKGGDYPEGGPRGDTEALDGSVETDMQEYSPISPGESRQGKIAYEVPSDRSEAYWTFGSPRHPSWQKSFWRIR